MHNAISRAHKESGKTDIYVIFSIALFFFAAAGAVLYFLILGEAPTKPDDVMERVVKAASSLETYVATVHVQPSPYLFVQDAFDGTVSFDIKNKISIGDFDMPVTSGITPVTVHIDTFSSDAVTFAKFSKKDNSVGPKLLFPEEWVSIDGTARFEIYQFIEKSLVLENVLKIAQEGKGRMVLNSDIITQDTDGSQEFHVVLRMKEKQPDVSQNVTKFFALVSPEDDIHLWIDAKTYNIREISYSVPGFSVKVDISKRNEPFAGSAPQNSISYTAWEGKFFSKLASVAHISEILIGSYGNINKAYLEGIQQSIQKTTGVKTTLQKSAPALEKKKLLYDTATDRWNSDMLLRGVKLASAGYGQNIFALYVIEGKMFSPLFPQKEIWSRGEIGSNAAVMTVGGLIPAGVASAATQTTALARAQKAALYVIGTNLGFEYSPSSSNSKCAMYPAADVAEIDAKDVGFCKPESTFLNQIFKK
jgi:predicted Zn-dependent protease